MEIIILSLWDKIKRPVKLNNQTGNRDRLVRENYTFDKLKIKMMDDAKIKLKNDRPTMTHANF